MHAKPDPSSIAIVSQAIGDDLALLSALHATELEAQTLSELKALGFPNNLGLNLNSEPSADILNHLSRVTAQWPDQADSSYMDNLAADYAAIYLNAQIGASPHESFWLDEEHLVMQKPMFQVRDQYQRQGLCVENWRSRADDHIVNELNFLAEMVKADMGQGKLAVAASFLDEHLLRWIDEFANRVAARSESDFYSGLALLTAVYCDELRSLLEVILLQPRPSKEEIEARMNEKEPDSVKVAPPLPGIGPSW